MSNPHSDGAPQAPDPAPDGAPSHGLVRDFSKAYRKARDWHCPRLRALVVAARYSLFGDSGRFASHGGWRVSRISRTDRN